MQSFHSRSSSTYEILILRWSMVCLYSVFIVLNRIEPILQGFVFAFPFLKRSAAEQRDEHLRTPLHERHRAARCSVARDLDCRVAIERFRFDIVCERLRCLEIEVETSRVRPSTRRGKNESQWTLGEEGELLHRFSEWVRSADFPFPTIDLWRSTETIDCLRRRFERSRTWFSRRRCSTSPRDSSLS